VGRTFKAVALWRPGRHWPIWWTFLLVLKGANLADDWMDGFAPGAVAFLGGCIVAVLLWFVALALTEQLHGELSDDGRSAGNAHPVAGTTET
jgi:hypothetical protein